MRKPIYIALLALIASASTICAHAQMVIIASADLKVESVSRNDVRDVFTGAAQNLHNGPRVGPVLLVRSAPHDEFLATYIGEKAVDFRADWMALLFAGKMRLPPTFENEGEVVDYVAHHASCLGYIHKDTRHPGVIVLIVK